MKNAPMNHLIQQVENRTGAEQHKPKQLFEAFEWSKTDPQVPSTEHADFTAMAMDITGGLKVCMQMLEHDVINSECEPQERLFNNCQAGVILRMCITSLDILNDKASSIIFNELRKGGEK